jgi:hypothetical protein
LTFFNLNAIILNTRIEKLAFSHKGNQMISASHVAVKQNSLKMKSLNRDAISAAGRLAKQLNARLVDTTKIQDDGKTLFNPDKIVDPGNDLYLWYWKSGFTKIENPNATIKESIMSALVDKPS